MDIRYPIGKFVHEGEVTQEQTNIWIGQLEEQPAKLRQAVSGLSGDQLNSPYREGGWTIRQVVHHLADAHLNGYMRHRLALTEERPTIKPFLENGWVELIDAKHGDISPSLLLLEGLVARWVMLLRSLNTEDLKREFYHPEAEKTFTLAYTLGMYTWHGNHHLAHINNYLNQRDYS